MTSRDFFEIDYLILIPVMALSAIGIAFIYSAGNNSEGIIVSTEYIRQIVWASAGLVIAIVLAMVNYRIFYRFSPHLFFGTAALLLYTVAFGRLTQGAGRWIDIAGTGIGLQVSEFAKVTMIIFLARYLCDTGGGTNDFARFAVSSLIVALPAALVFVQPDLGSALVFVAILLSMTFAAGISAKYIAFTVACILLTGVLTVLPYWEVSILQKTVPAIKALENVRLVLIAMLSFSAIVAIAVFGFLRYRKGYFFWIAYCMVIAIFAIGMSFVARGLLRDYQIMRLVVFLDPNVDPRGAGWNIIQSMTAIGAGGFSGAGFLKGTQSSFRYLPEQSTDFIFSMFSEESGFIGGIVVFLLFLIIFMRFLRVMKITADPFAVYICAGLFGMYGFHFIVNVGMTMGIMPITGIPLVFMSYGGSSMLSAMIGIGIALSIHVRRYTQMAV